MTARTEAFSDGVFAIAITLLVLEIKVPPVHEIHSTEELWHHLGMLWPSYFAFATSFAIILVNWTGHHVLIKKLDKSNMKFLYANGFLLFSVSLIPFTTALLGEYMNTDYASPAAIILCSGMTLTSIGWRALIQSTLKPVLLVKEGIDLKQFDDLKKNNLFTIAFSFILAVVAIWFPIVAVILNASMWIVWIFFQIRLNES